MSRRDLRPRPDAIGDYVPLRLLGAGAMAAVWLCRGPDGQQVAVKWLDRVTPTIRARFLREYEALKRLNDAHIITALDQGSAEGRPFIVMAYVEGVDLRVYASKLRLRPASERAEEVRRIGQALCRALEAVHSAGLIHRDVKPSNVLLDARGRVRLTDFGVVKDTDLTEQTRAGVLVGTAAYAAPEQILGDALDPRTDLYGLGCTLYYLATGQRPYPAAEREALVAAHLRAAVPHVSLVDPRFPTDLGDVIARLMAKSPGDRYADAVAARKALAAGKRASGTPLAGRRRYVDQVIASLERVKAGEGRVLLVEGPLGSGRRWLLSVADDLAGRAGLSLVTATDEATLADATARLMAGETLLVVTSLRPAAGAAVAVDAIRMVPLGMADVRRTVVSIAPRTNAPSLIAERLHRASGGHPAWLVPMLEACRVGLSSALVLPETLPVPAALVKAIDELDFEASEVLVALAALERPADRGLLEAAAQLPAEAALEGLEAAGLVTGHQGLWWPIGEVVGRAAMQAAADPDASRARAQRALAALTGSDEVAAPGADIRRASLSGALADALERAAHAATMTRASGDRADEARAALTLGAVALDAGDLIRADQALSDAVALARAVSLHPIRRAAHVLRAQATLESRPGNPGAATAALDRLNRALTRVPGDDPEGYRALAAAVQARAFAVLGDRTSWREASERADAASAHPLLEAQVRLELARAALLAGDREGARERARGCMAAAAEAKLSLLVWLAARVLASADGAATPPPTTWLPDLSAAMAERLSARPV